jgi:hypothetical protein
MVGIGGRLGDDSRRVWNAGCDDYDDSSRRVDYNNC